jgi:hypothetical protein
MLSLLFFFSCGVGHQKIISQKQFIEIYARLLIIDELELSTEYKERLRIELMQQYKITRADIDRTIAYYNSQPEKWIDLLGKIRDRIEKLRTTKLTQTQP